MNDKINSKQIGSFIRLKREEAGWSQERLARESGLIYDSTLNRIENGNRHVKWDEMCSIAAALGNFHPFEAMEAAGYITRDDICPQLLLHRLEELDKEELSEVQKYVDYLIYKKGRK